MLRKAKLLFAGFGILIVGILISAILKSMRTSLILSMGIVAADSLQTGVKWVFLIAGMVSIGIGVGQIFPSAIEQYKEYKRKQRGSKYRAKTSGEEEIREQLKFMKTSRPGLSDDIDECLKQFDRFDSILSRFDELISANTANQVAGSRVGLEEIGLTLNGNFKWVISYSIASDKNDSDFTEKCLDRISQVIDANNKALDAGNDFLFKLAENISQKDTSVINTKLKAWMTTISEQNEQSKLGDEKDEN